MQESNRFALEYDVVDREGDYNADRLKIFLGSRICDGEGRSVQGSYRIFGGTTT